MKHAEVIYETGDKSVVSYEDLDELKSALANQHGRAMRGESGAAQNFQERDDLDAEDAARANTIAQRPAERIVKVILYEEHPGDMAGGDKVSTESINTLIEGMTAEDGTVDAEQLVRALRDERSAVYPTDQGRHESMFKAEGEEMTDLTFLEGDEDA